MEKIPRLASALDNPDEREVMRYQVRLSDLDTNTHLHGSHYAKLAIDAVGAYLSIDPLKEEFVVERLHIQFMNEARFNDRLVFYVIPDPEQNQRLFVEGRLTESDDIAFLVTMEYILETFTTA